MKVVYVGVSNLFFFERCLYCWYWVIIIINFVDIVERIFFKISDFCVIRFVYFGRRYFVLKIWFRSMELD